MAETRGWWWDELKYRKVSTGKQILETSVHHAGWEQNGRCQIQHGSQVVIGTHQATGPIVNQTGITIG